jgi:uncharacterized membrane protein YhaH (DUF805 family)
MTFTESIQTCFKKYAEFNGRAGRSEFWWWMLFAFLLSVITQKISHNLWSLLSLITFLPSIAVTARRLHDIGRSGWWQLVGIIPMIGWAVLIYWCVQESSGTNEFDR